MSQKVYLWILRVGVALSFLSVFLVYTNFLFPFITSKQVYFNVLIEILVVFWLSFIIKYPLWNPFKTREKKGFINKALEKVNIFKHLGKKKNSKEEEMEEIREKYIGSGITFALIAFFAVMLLSSFFGVDFNLSFWGDIERMLGFFHVVHFLFLYLIIITIMRDWNDWKWLLIFFVGIVTIVALTGIYGAEAYGTVGNEAYMAGFMLFGIFFSALLFFREKTLFKWLYPIPVLIMLVAFKGAGIAGAYAGFGAGVLTFLFFFGLLNSNKKLKIASLSLFVIIILGGVFALTHKDYPVIRNIKPIQDFSFQENTFQTRLIAWSAALKDFKDHPVLGTGHGNFAITFDKYFDPKFYNFTRSGTYFDRAHNNLIDIISTTGILGLLSYLSIFIAVLYYFWKIYKRKRTSYIELSILLALLAAYFVQNLAVFDSLPTYISLMLFLGFIHFLFNTREDGNNKKELYVKDDRLINREIYSLIIFSVISVVIIFQYSYVPGQMLYQTIEGQKAFAQRDVYGAYLIYDDFLSRGSVLDRDSRDSFIRSIMENPAALTNMEANKRNEVLKKGIDWAWANVDYNQEDSLFWLRLAQTYNYAARLNYEDKDVFNEYVNQALFAVNKSIELSPGRIPVYMYKNQVLITMGRYDDAVDILEKALELNDQYEEVYCNLAETYLINQNEEKGFEKMDKCLEMEASKTLRYSSVVKNAINHYMEAGDMGSVLKLYEKLSQLQGNDPKVWVGLTQLYIEQGQKDKAVKAAERAAQLDPSLASDVESFIKSLEE